MNKYIFTTRDKIHVINLEKTLEQLKSVLEAVSEVASADGTVMFVGTKRQAKDAVRVAAESCGMPYVTVRWLGGTFTNFRTIQRTVKKLERLQRTAVSEDFDTKYTKKERLLMTRELQKLQKLFEGFKSMKKLPEIIFVIDVGHEIIAVREAKKSGVKVAALVDTNSDPALVDYPIPCNDDSIKAISLMAGLVAQAVNEGKAAAPKPAPEPVPEEKKQP